MNIQEQIDEILSFFEDDCSYSAITGTIFYGDIDSNVYKKEEVEEYSFDHVFQVSNSMGNMEMEDYYSGITLVPVGNNVYIKCEWSS
jgi:hypothetical protein